MRDRFLRWMGSAPSFARVIVVLWYGVSILSVAHAERQARSRPNVLFIMTDQHRFDCLGANGNAIIQTPQLDHLAERSANFQYAFVQSPVCVPSRATFFTGRYPHCHKNRVNYTPLKHDEVLLQKLLQDAGYSTGVVGKLHLYPPTKQEARRTGFDHVYLHDATGRRDQFSDYVKWRDEHDPNKHIPYRRYADNIESGKNPFRAAIADEFTETSWVGQQSQELLKSMAEEAKPFFLFVSFWKPHSPYEVPVPYDSLYDDVEVPLPPPVTLEDIQRLPPPLQKQILRGRTPHYTIDRTRLQWIYRSYYAAVSHVDREVGTLLATLEATGEAGNTIVIFTSDHGDQLLEHGLLEKNVFFESSVRIPFLFSYPGRVRPGKYNELIETTDLMSTLCELVGIEEPKHAQGRSFAPLVMGRKGEYKPRDVVFSENIIPEVITTSSLNLYYKKGEGVGGVRHPDSKMVRSHRWKLNYYPDGYGELYDLENDPGETRNLYDDPLHRKVVIELKGRLLDWLITADETEQIAERWLR